MFSLVLSTIAIIVSVYSIYSSRRSEKRLLRINFLLPHLSDISHYIHKKELNGHPNNADEYAHLIKDLRDYFLVRQQVIKGIGLTSIFNRVSQLEDKDDFFIALGELTVEIDNKYLELIGLG